MSALVVGQRIRVVHADAWLNGRTGEVAVTRARPASGASDDRAWVELDEDLPAHLQSFDPEDRFGRGRWALLWPKECVRLPDVEAVLSAGCPVCGSEGLHACTGAPVAWDEEKKQKLQEALARFRPNAAIDNKRKSDAN